MEIIIKENEKLVEVWLSSAEASSAIIRNGLKPLYARHRSQGYKVVVFESGRHDLFANTRDLLLENRMCANTRKSTHNVR